ncbi:MAG: hypothetical protein HY599_02240 [Candidatus Omnitrophica bacterium]|nr:hypothetical protein [Candidatus Omnitrophota bacterium]
MPGWADRRGPAHAQGLTLVEVVLGVLTLAIIAAAILGAYIGQVTLNEHARNLSFAIQDVSRVIEQIRRENVGCTTPEVVPAGATSWNAWLEAQAPAKTIPVPAAQERIVVTCSHRNGPASGLCGSGNQVGAGEWTSAAGTTNLNPLAITVAVCWRQRNRTIGECTFNAGTGALTPVDGSNGPNDVAGVIESPAMVTTLVTCRS